MEKLNEFHLKDKKNYKLVKLATKAELCLSRANAKMIIKKAEKLLKWKPNISLEKGLELTINHFKNKLNLN